MDHGRRREPCDVLHLHLQAHLKLVELNDVKREWAWIRPRLERLLGKVKSDGWIPEDIYAAIVSGRASLYVSEDHGFAVAQLFPHYTGKRLHMWVVDTVEPERFLGDMITLAKSLGAARVTFESPRKGWERRAGRLGFKAVRVVYEMEVA